MKDSIRDTFLSIKSDPTTYWVGVVVVLALLRDWEFLAITALILIWLRNDQKLGIRLRELFEKVGKEGFQFRPPPEETAKAEKAEWGTKPDEASADYMLFQQANNLLSQNRFMDAEEKYLETIEKTSDLRVKTNCYINLGVIYMRLWHQTHKQEFLDKSIDASKTALELDPEGYRSRLNLAVAYSKNRKTEVEALRYFDEADSRGDLKDPHSWGKVKLFKASLIATLSGRPNGQEYANRLNEAELSLLESLRLFEMVKDHPEIPWLVDEARSLLDFIKKKKDYTAGC